MSSTLTLPTTWSAPATGRALVDALLLPAATCAPAALVIAVDTRVSQETSVLAQDVVARGTQDGLESGLASGIESGSGIGSGNGTADAAVLAAAYAAAVPFAVPAAVRTRKHVQGPPSRGTPV